MSRAEAMLDDEMHWIENKNTKGDGSSGNSNNGQNNEY